MANCHRWPALAEIDLMVFLLETKAKQNLLIGGAWEKVLQQAESLCKDIKMIMDHV